MLISESGIRNLVSVETGYKSRSAFAPPAGVWMVRDVSCCVSRAVLAGRRGVLGEVGWLYVGVWVGVGWFDVCW